MPKNAYYIYALKDPRTSPAKPFYIGKGTGVRAWEHLLKVDSTRKGRRIEDIVSSGGEVVVTKLADDLTELQALKLEAELIAALGTEGRGGILTNAVAPTGMVADGKLKIVVPMGAPEKAQMALSLLKESVIELAKANPGGVTNSEIVRALGLQSDYLGGSKDYLSWSLLGLLMREGKMERVQNKRHVARVK